MTRALVVYVHGLWLSGREALMLRRRLRQEFDFDLHAFHYPSVSARMSDVVESLQRFVEEMRGGAAGPGGAPAALPVHFIGHSLGGLILYRFFERHPEQPPGRVVFLGTPAVASRAAARVARHHWACRLVGHCVAEELAGRHERSWALPRELGIVAGTRRLGLGQFVAGFDEPCDGTIAVSETQLPGATAHLALPVSHMGMLFSPRVAREVGAFLESGRFAAQSPVAEPPRSSSRSR